MARESYARHPVEGRENDLRSGIHVPALTRGFVRDEDEFPGQTMTTTRTDASAARDRERDGGREGSWGMQEQRTQGARGARQDGSTGFTMGGPQQPAPLFDPTPLQLEKSNILLLGPSGVGKTLMAKTLARVLEVPFSMSDCTPFTQAGYIGEDAEVCIQRLLAASNYDVARAERGIVCLDEIDKIAAAPGRMGSGRDVSGEGVQQALLKIVEGTTVQVQAKAERGSTPGPPGTSGGRGGHGAQQGHPPTNSPLAGGGGQQNASGAPPQKGEMYNVKTDNILFICAGAFNGLHKMVMDRISKGSIGFGATVRAAPGTSSSSDGSPTSNPHETILEGEDDLFEKHLPYYAPPPPPSPTPGAKRTNKRSLNTLDLVSPQDLQKYGLIPELVGRLPISCALSSLSIPALVQVLTEPRNSLLKQYEQLFQLSQIELRFTNPALHVVAETASKMGTGARGLRTVMERLLGDAMFEAPGSGVKYVLVTEEVTKLKAPPVYLQRGQQGKFHGLIAAEEEMWEERKRREEGAGGGEGWMEERARVNSEGGAARTFQDYREKVGAAGF